MKRKDYKDARVKDNAWVAVSSKVALSVPECKRKWKNLRDRYVRELKALKKPTGTGGPAPVSQWPYFNIMSFIKDTVRHRKYIVIICCRLDL